MELLCDIGMKLVLQGVESDIACLQHMALERTKSILCCWLHIGDVVEELGLFVESSKVQEIATDATIGRDHELKGRRKLPHVAVVLVEEGDQVFTVSTRNCIMPWGVIQLDHPTCGNPKPVPRLPWWDVQATWESRQATGTSERSHACRQGEEVGGQSRCSSNWHHLRKRRFVGIAWTWSRWCRSWSPWAWACSARKGHSQKEMHLLLGPAWHSHVVLGLQDL